MSDPHFIIMRMNYDICIVDLLVHDGYFELALNFTIKIPIKSDLGMWMCLLGSCKLNVMVHAIYLDEALKFTTKIPIKFELGVW